MCRACALLATTILLCSATPARAGTTHAAKLGVTFLPSVLGRHAAVDMSLRVHTLRGSTPPPLTAIDLRYPSVLGFTVSGLGISTCSQPTIELLGPSGCAADSRMGAGSAIVEIPYGSAIVDETAAMTIVRAPEQKGRFALLFYASGISPIIASLVFPGLFLQGPTPSEETVEIELPPVQGFPGSPYAAVLAMHAIFGAQDLTYYEYIRGRRVPYRPQGILLPNTCPGGGFAFSARLAFLDGTHTVAHDVVPCPKRR